MYYYSHQDNINNNLRRIKIMDKEILTYAAATAVAFIAFWGFVYALFAAF
jgi:hypothetical protein